MRYNTDNQFDDEAPWPNATNVVIAGIVVAMIAGIAYGAYKLFKYGLITL
jgi:hypothetical protein